jgi:hypothetical protein
LSDVGPELQIQEHSVGYAEQDVVITMLWDPSESTAPRPPEATMRVMTISHAHVLGELEADPSLAFARTQA